ncbi:NlpC/P60 family protein [Nocardioides sp.]|uniref:C40 family peptidase n=1 Tax=Nocardioides sp. TaxID=35761 RepID=UPI0031FE4738|nr:hypothetical protein [Nocardioides sp.]
MTNPRQGALARVRTAFFLSIAALAGASALAVVAPAPAGAVAVAEARPAQRTHHHASRGSRVVGIARHQAGKPYAYGASGPGAFDCSGLTMWVYRHVGVHLPHSSAAQAGRTRRIPRAAARRGDLVFFTDGGGVYHVAIYAGGNYVWHAPHSGARVRHERIWTSSVFFGRVR